MNRDRVEDSWKQLRGKVNEHWGKAALLSALLAAGGQVIAQERMNTDAYKAERERIQAVYKNAKDTCDKLSGNAEDVCQAQAKADRRIAEADLEAKHKGTTEARAEARMVRADAHYEVAKEKCDDLSGNSKDKCIADAKAAAARAKAEAKQ